MRHDKDRITSRSSKVGLVLSAGGARGAYQIGCWRALQERNVRIGAISGSSIGALNGALVCQGDWARASDLWLELTQTRIIGPDMDRLKALASAVAWDLALLLMPVPSIKGVRLLKYAVTALWSTSRWGSLGSLRRDGLIDIAGFKPLLMRYLDLQIVLKQPVPLFVTASSPPKASTPLGVAHSFKLQDLPEEDAWKVLAASMALPFLFSSIEMQGDRYVDGGIGQWLPLAPLHGSSTSHLVVVSTKADTKIASSAYPGKHILLIKPRKPLGRFPVATFRFTRSAVTEWMERGYEDASVALERERMNPGA